MPEQGHRTPGTPDGDAVAHAVRLPVDGDGFHQPVGSSCCNAPVVAHHERDGVTGIGPFVALWDLADWSDYTDHRCRKCNRPVAYPEPAPKPLVVADPPGWNPHTPAPVGLDWSPPPALPVCRRCGAALRRHVDGVTWAAFNGPVPLTECRATGGPHEPGGRPGACPDGGTCHHACPDATPDGPPGPCWRVLNAGPLSAAGYPGNDWPDDIVNVHLGRALDHGAPGQPAAPALRDAMAGAGPNDTEILDELLAVEPGSRAVSYAHRHEYAQGVCDTWQTVQDGIRGRHRGEPATPPPATADDLLQAAARQWLAEHEGTIAAMRAAEGPSTGSPFMAAAEHALHAAIDGATPPADVYEMFVATARAWLAEHPDAVPSLVEWNRSGRHASAGNDYVTDAMHALIAAVEAHQ